MAFTSNLDSKDSLERVYVVVKNFISSDWAQEVASREKHQTIFLP